MAWNILQGAVILTATDGTEHEFTKATEYAFNAVEWRAKSGSARVNAAFCTKPTKWNGAGCS